MLDISVIVTTFNRGDQVTALVKTLREHHGYELEIIVSDDGSDPKPEVSGMCIYTWQEDLGNRAATARNAGIERATHGNILFLDDDVHPHPMILRAHLLALSMYDISIGLLPRGDFSEELDERARMFLSREALWRFAWTGNIAVRRSVIEAVGGFDERFNGGHGFEDLDFAKSAERAGMRMFLNKLAFAVHPDEHTSSEPNEKVLLNKRKFEEKWGQLV